MRSEAEFTYPSDRCPHPEYWTAPDSDSTEAEVSELVGALVRALQPEFVVETGTAFGYTALAVAKALRANGHGRLVSLEIDPERLHSARRRLAEHTSYVEVRAEGSLDYAPDQKIDFAWFDSLPHLRAEEFKRYFGSGHLRPGAIVGFHDTAPGAAGGLGELVRRGIEELVELEIVRAISLPTPRGVTFAEVQA